MLAPAIQLYDVVVAVHVFAVVLAFGVTFSYPVVMPWLRANRPEFMETFHETQDRIGKLLITPAMVVVLLSGIYLATDADVWSEAWVTIPFIILIVLFAMGGAFFSRRERAIRATAHRDIRERGELSAEYDHQFVVLSRGAAVAAVLVAVAVFVMVAKPF